MKKWIYLISSAFILFFIFNVAAAQAADYGYISGKIMTVEGDPMYDGKVYFFDVTKGPLPYTSEYWRVQDYAVRIADDGSFKAGIPAGTYYVMAVKKFVGKQFAPPEEGDLIYPPWDGRVPDTYIVRVDERTKVGVISGAVPFQSEWAAKGKTRIEGIVVDVNGNPVKDILISAGSLIDENLLYVADVRTGLDGKYIVRVPEGGTYNLIIAGMGQPLSQVTLATDELRTGINVTFPDNTGAGD